MLGIISLSGIPENLSHSKNENCKIADKYYSAPVYSILQIFTFEVKVIRLFESKNHPLAPIGVFRKRILKSVLLGICVMIVCLMIGILGYHFLAGVPWLDSLHNASMILSGMGPVVEIKTTAGKWFSSFYALFSGVIFITNIGVILAPAIHRFFHSLHLELYDNKT